jgi:hypothetical protein
MAAEEGQFDEQENEVGESPFAWECRVMAVAAGR